MKNRWVFGLMVGLVVVVGLIAGGVIFAFQDRQPIPEVTPEKPEITEKPIDKEPEEAQINGEEFVGKVIIPPEYQRIVRIEYKVSERELQRGWLDLRVRVISLSDREIQRGNFIITLTDKAGNPHPEEVERVIQTFYCEDEFDRLCRESKRPEGFEIGPGRFIQSAIGPGETVELKGARFVRNLEEFWEPVGGVVITVEGLQLG